MKRISSKTLTAQVLPVAIVVSLAKALPWALKRRMSPPLRETLHTPADLGLPGREVWLAGARDKKLHGWWIPVAHEAPVVVVIHGWGANASLMLPFAGPLHHAGFHTFFIDARGHGLSESDDYASMPRFAEDLEVAIDWVQSNPRVTDVGVLGHSIGAGAAVLTASRRPDVDALVCASGCADVWEVMTQHGALERMPTPASWAMRRAMEAVAKTTFEEVAPERVISEVNAPTMIVHGDADEVVPLEQAYRLAEARGETELLVVPGGRHGDLSTFEAHIGPILAFLAEHLG